MFPFRTKKSRPSEVARGAERYEAQAEAALDAGDIDTAIECYRAALELCPFNESFREGLADALLLKAQQKDGTRRRASQRESAPTLPRNTARSVEPRRVVRSSRTREELPEPEVEELPTPRPTRAPGMAFMDSETAREKQRAARARKVVEEFEDEEEEVARPKARDEVRRPVPRTQRQREKRTRFMVMAALYTGVLLVLVGVAHGLITNAVGSAPLPEVPKVEKVPDGVSLALEQATRELLRGAPQSSVTLLEKALVEFPDHQDLLNAALARSLRAAGNKHLETRDYVHAAEAFERATRVDPLNADNWIELGRSFREHGRTVQASNSAEGKRLLLRSSEAYKRALEVSPGDPSALVGLAQAYSHLGERQKAVENYQAVVNKAPDSKEAAVARQHLQQLIGRS